MTDHRPWVVVPLKETPQAKRRLAGLLSPAERGDLVAAMLADVLTALTPLSVPILVVCSDRTLRPIAEAHGTQLLDDPGGGLNRAAAVAAQWLEHRSARSMLLVPGDVPALTAAECSRLLAACSTLRTPSVGIAADRHARGTNALWCSPPSALPATFGLGSAHRHIMAANHVASEALWWRSPGFSLDIDTPEDLCLLRHRSTTADHTLSFIHSAGLAERLASHRRD